MGLSDRVAEDNQIARRNVRRNAVIKWGIYSAAALAVLLFVVFYYLLPWWRG